ncbi:hypothetical protein AYI69_g7203 [Smittium culicis]|uniref:Uncharacterized protein n=1 Tax=Smittium culicis TaxID=133412 RepID=A0A1R1XTP6_9FUNG|nr:hypothetical protein AYI69_g7203 [Smittium culicis]
MNNRSTGISPAKMLYGIEMKLPTTWELSEQIEDFEEEAIKRIEIINIDLPEIRKQGLNKNIQSKNIAEKRYNQQVNYFQFKIGNKVLKHVDVPKEKFSPIWEGPFTVVEVGDLGAYTITDDFGNYDQVNGDKLKPYHHSNRMIPEISTTKLQSTLHKFRQVSVIMAYYNNKRGGLLHE